MRTLLFAFSILLCCHSYSQSKHKLSKDSIAYYRKQLNELTKSTYDSLINSPKYQEIFNKVNLKNSQFPDKFGVEFVFFSGCQKNDHANLNSRLDSLGLNESGSIMFPLGVGLALRFNKIILGFDLTPVLIADNSTGASFHFYASTNVLKAGRWIISPQLGYTGMYEILRISTKTSSPDFNNYFTTSANQVEVIQGNGFADFGISFKIYQKNSHTYIPIFRIGYRVGLKNQKWEVTHSPAMNGPFDRNNNFYLHLMFGFGD
jgi:hypothetical protein